VGCLAIILLVFGFMFFGISSVETSPETMMMPTLAASSASSSYYASIPQSRTEDGAFVLGYASAPITIVAFEDFLCPHCQNYEPDIQEFIHTYVVTGQARFEFRMLPISQISSVSFGLAECADELEPGSFWVAHDTLFDIASTTRFSQESPRVFAEALNLSYSDLLDCLATADQYQIDTALASHYNEVTGTPSVGWRLGDGELRFDQISRRPTVDELGALIRSQSQ